MKARIHRFNKQVAVHLHEGKTIYLTTSMAFAVANAMTAAASDICMNDLAQDSKFKTVEIEQLSENIVAQEG